MTDLEKAKQLFQKAGLGFPTMPKHLAAALRQQDEWLFSTRQIEMSPYNLDHYVREVDSASADDYVVLCHSGHGANSYAIQYYLVYGPLAMFLHLGWGGVYMDKDADTAKLGACFLMADDISILAFEKLAADSRIRIVVSDFYGSYWAKPGEHGDTESQALKQPEEVLADATCWLRGL